MSSMKLKTLVASILLGLSGSAFADSAASGIDTQSQLDAMRAQIAKMEAVINQNHPGVFYQSNDWFNRITISGMANVDAFTSNTTPVFRNRPNGSGSVQGLFLNNANMFLNVKVNNWVKGDLAFVYQDTNTSYVRRPTTSVGQTDFGSNLDEAYITIGDFNKTPFYFRAGRTYLPFGEYARFPLVENPTQLLSETRATAATLGFVHPVGLYANVTGFQGLPKGNATSNLTQGHGYNADGSPQSRVTNFGGNAGYAYNAERVGFKFDVGYINNMNNVNFVSAGVPYGYQENVGALAAGADLRYAAWDVGAHWVGALQQFALADLTNGAGGKAKPRAIGATAGYSFPVLAHQTRFGLGYQHTWDSSLVGSTIQTINGDGKLASRATAGLPQNRWYGEYMFNVSKWTDVGLALIYDRDYSTGNSGTGNSATTGVARLSVKFA